MEDWPKVHERDDGIRPAGNPDQCLYCSSLVGEEHARDCVVITKKVKVRFSFTIEIDVPHSWSKEDIEFHHNEGTWCADNAYDLIDAHVKSQWLLCSCDLFHSEFLEVTDATPRRNLQRTGGAGE
jgi:hypothetical protein